MKYASIENLYKAEVDEKGHPLSRGPQHGFSQEAFGQVGRWLVLEKVDGMNVRVILTSTAEGREVTFHGRTDKAALPGDLLDYLRRTFTVELLERAVGRVDAETGELELPPVTVLYGEGYGAGIQKAGRHYRPDKGFILFDVLLAGEDWRYWWRFDQVIEAADVLDVSHVPVLARDATLDEACQLVRTSALLRTSEAEEHVEGVVLRTDPYLFDGRGNRVIAKYKVRDL